MWLVSVIDRELRDGAAPQGQAPLDQPRDARQLAGLREVQQVAAVGPVPQHADHVTAGAGRLEVLAQHPAVERLARRRRPGPSPGRPARNARVGPTSTRRACASTYPRRGTPAPLRMSGARDWMTSRLPCSPTWPPSSGKKWRGVCTIARSGLRSGSAKNDRSRCHGQGIGVLRRDPRRGVGQLGVVRQEGERVLAADRVGAARRPRRGVRSGSARCRGGWRRRARRPRPRRRGRRSTRARARRGRRPSAGGRLDLPWRHVSVSTVVREQSSVLWVSAFLDLPGTTFESAVGFWEGVTGFGRSTPRGEHGEFATLVPPASLGGDDYLRVQRLGDGPARLHLDLHVMDPARVASRAVDLGASELARPDGYVVLRYSRWSGLLPGRPSGRRRPRAGVVAGGTTQPGLPGLPRRPGRVVRRGDGLLVGAHRASGRRAGAAPGVRVATRRLDARARPAAPAARRARRSRPGPPRRGHAGPRCRGRATCRPRGPGAGDRRVLDGARRPGRARLLRHRPRPGHGRALVAPRSASRPASAPTGSIGHRWG